MIELLNIDCMTYMATQPDKSFDLAVVDPPYGLGDFTRSNSRGVVIERKYQRAYWNQSGPSPEYFQELERTSRNRIIFGANYFNCFQGGGCLVWDKNNNHPDMSRCEIASLSFKRTVDYVCIEYFGFTDRDRVHPCQKPIKLYEWLLGNYAKKGQRILDTHAGSMSSVIAAHYFGCDIVACEIDREYFEAGKARFERETRQLAMF